MTNIYKISIGCSSPLSFCLIKLNKNEFIKLIDLYFFYILMICTKAKVLINPVDN